MDNEQRSFEYMKIGVIALISFIIQVKEGVDTYSVFFGFGVIICFVMGIYLSIKKDKA